jgi:hypothetical protein
MKKYAAVDNRMVRLMADLILEHTPLTHLPVGTLNG